MTPAATVPAVETVGVVGLGVMGSAMAANLVEGGWPVIGYDIDADRLDRLDRFGGTPAGSADEVAAAADVVLLSLPTIEALDDVSRAIAPLGGRSGVIVETSTLPLSAKERARVALADAGVAMLDAPVSGTGIQAAEATLVVLSSGDEVVHRAVEPVLDGIGSVVHHLGPFGNGSRMKFVANLLVVVHTLVAAEAHALAAVSGLDPRVVQEVVAAGVGSSRMFEVRGPMMVDGRYEPPSARLDILRKDAAIIADHARDIGAATPLLDAALPLYEQATRAGLGHLDAASLRSLLDDLAVARSEGLEPPTF